MSDFVEVSSQSPADAIAQAERDFRDCTFLIPEHYDAAGIAFNSAAGPVLIITGEGVPAMQLVAGRWIRIIPAEGGMS